MADGPPGKLDGSGLQDESDVRLPPPSTLAAQLVENISASPKSSRYEENNELKGFFAIIQRVKDNPDLLQSPADRIEHNHMLIYVYVRVVLENLKLDDLFLDQAQTRREALRALNFLRFTVKETPAVLKYEVKEGSFLYRGSEPLWAWLLPQLLRILGHRQCVDLEGPIEGFLQYLLLVIARSGALWEISAPFNLYIQSILTGLIQRLQDPSTSINGTEDLSLPPSFSLDFILGKNWLQSKQRASYVVREAKQMLRQGMSLAKVLTYPLVSSDQAFLCSASLTEAAPWVIDTWLDIYHTQRRWEPVIEAQGIQIVESMLGIAKSIRTWPSAESILNKARAVLVLLCSSVVTVPQFLVDNRPGTEENRRIFSVALLSIAEASIEDSQIGRMAASKIVDELRASAVSHDSDIWRCAKILQQVTGVRSEFGTDGAVEVTRFQDPKLSQFVQGCLPLRNKIDYADAPNKRQRTSQDHEEHPNAATGQIATLLQIEVSKLKADTGFDALFFDAFHNSDERTQCLSIDLLSRSLCIADQSMEPGQVQQCRIASARCTVCDEGSGGSRSSTSNDFKSEMQEVLNSLTRSPSFLASRKPRVAAMIALRRFVKHTETPGFLDLETSHSARWCLQSLNSSVRELRIAAGRTLTAFVSDKGSSPQCEQTIIRNRKNAIAFLKQLSEKNQSRLVETCILAWGQLGRIASEDELNLVLIKMVDYLGSSNSVISACAFNELLNLADARKTTPRRLLEPYWRSLAYLTTKDMIQRPQKSRAIAELLQVSVNELLLLIQTHALPWLVLENRKDIIQKIAESRQEEEVWQPLLDSSNLAAILALLLTQDTEKVDAFVQTRLNEVSPHFHARALLDLLQMEPVLIAMELLKAAGDADASRKPLAHKALYAMANMILASSKDTKHKKGNSVGRFLQVHVLGIMARLADVINDSTAAYTSVIEQRRCIRALEEMITVCQGYCRVARPQISACLLSALAQEPLREASFACWKAMLIHLEEEDVEALLETSFFIVSHYWTVLNVNTKSTAKDMLCYVLDNHSPVVSRGISHLPKLANIPDLADISSKLKKIRPVLSPDEALSVFSERLNHDHSGVVHQALMELVSYLRENHAALCSIILSQRPDSSISPLLRALLDCGSKYHGTQPDISRLCTECVGLIGCLDSNQVESVREQRSIVVLSNFQDPKEVTDFILFLLEVVLVPSFLSATDTRLQGFLSFAMQELLDRSDIREACAMQNQGIIGGSEEYRKWISLPENIREVATPFLTSRYRVAPMAPVTIEYPIFKPGRTYGNWLRSFVLDLLHKGQHPYADTCFEPLTRVIRVKDLSTTEFLLPYLVLHILLGPRSSEEDRRQVLNELILILEHQLSENATYLEKEDSKRACHAVFRALDYMMRWVQAKRSVSKLSSSDKEGVARIQEVLDSIPAELIAERAIECNEFARALFHLEQDAQPADQQKREPSSRTRLLERLQNVYASIDEPDGLDGISAHLHSLDFNQQILSHKKAGRWEPVQTWYEMQLAENPERVEYQIDLLNCLKQAGQHDVLLNHVDGIHMDNVTANKIIPFAVEAAWVTGRWESLVKFVSRFQGSVSQDFNVSLGSLFELLYRKRPMEDFAKILQETRESIGATMNTSATTSFQTAHDILLKCHVLTDLEIIVGARPNSDTMALLNDRLEVTGAYFNDKQYLLGIRRAAMELTRPTFSNVDISSLWLSSARLARKTGSLHQSFNAVLHASRLGDDAATIENAKLLWKDNHHRKATQMLQGAIERNRFMTQTGASTSTNTTKLSPHQKLLTARAQLLLAKWLDAAGQSHASALREKYQQPPKTLSSWEKGHYYLGRHYKKLLEAEKSLKVDDQGDDVVTGQTARLVIENYVRSLHSGTKYLYQTLPRILTLWLDLGAQIDKPPEGKLSLSRELHRRRLEELNILHSFLDRYIQRLPAFVFYTALPQIVARIAHPTQSVFDRLAHIIVKVVEAYPRQALWSLIGIITTKQSSERKSRGMQVLQTLRAVSKKVDGASFDLKYLIRASEKLADQLLMACQNGDFSGNKSIHASLSRDLRFNHKCTPCPLVVPVETTLTATLPTASEQVKKHKAFSRDVVTVECFLDDVLVLSSLAKPRRLTARGSDGKSYMLLIKPKDDLRTDQRLMEFNAMINRSLKRDAESSRRQLYIRTYAVVPLNEECGIIEWVPGIKTMRDILLGLYASRNIQPNYMMLKQLMEEAAMSEANTKIFTNDVLARFPPMLHLWFIDHFPNPSAWFAARLRYTRSCAVMSMVGTILGLGDRHGENVNLEEGNGGIFHVDFNCLFDKGLTFAKPERVPFRLTHNMVAAMGIYGYEGPFRKSSELTLSILRQQEETLMTILEAFIYDPTLDLQKDKRAHKKSDGGVKLQPQSVVDSIKRKVRGLLGSESIPLGVEGQVEELIKQAVDPRNLTAMYIGWCPFL